MNKKFVYQVGNNKKDLLLLCFQLKIEIYSSSDVESVGIVMSRRDKEL